jgi:hypothetical protein
MINPTRFATTLFLGAVSGVGFYSVSLPAARLGAFAMRYFVPEQENNESRFKKADRRDVPDTFESRWSRVSRLPGADGHGWNGQIATASGLC